MTNGIRWTEEQLAAHQRRAVKRLDPDRLAGIAGVTVAAADRIDVREAVADNSIRRKYRNQPTVKDGIAFDSKKEAKRYCELRAMLRAGEIQCLARQVSFWLPGEIEYRADFVYEDMFGFHVIEDVKSDATRKLPAYVMKKKLMRSLGYEITEI